MNKTRIWHAYQWTCDECGRDNFERAVPCELTDEDRAMTAEENGIEIEEMDGDWFSYPELVTCQHCGTEYETEDEDEYDDDDRYEDPDE